eukprot:CAMPEP_0172681552 /NCGR_PEP_ID=MMETSP1074-20121228/17527_1 /TAXON_ID=2916 /ORGANISM="Ceratium fusus, Strain PA161109" /LENGTH=760 /DNA_ID=CAMNT_0013500075 /DNA_START=6 /DNA_END=2288 /DNA_ORIENTATION=-
MVLESLEAPSGFTTTRNKMNVDMLQREALSRRNDKGRDTIAENCCSSSPQLQGSASALLRRAKLCVDTQFGAGLELITCAYGYLVDSVETVPGQPDLRVGDVIMAIGSELLVDLPSPDDLERGFALAFHDRAVLVVGSHEHLLEYPASNLKEDVAWLLMPSPVANASVGASCNQQQLSGTLGFSINDTDTGVEVAEGGMHVANVAAAGQGWSGARGRPGVFTGAYQFEVELTTACLIRAGWAASTSKRCLGKDSRSFGYGGTAMRSHAGKFEPYGDVFEGRCGAVITCVLDRRGPHRQTISYRLDGRCLGVAFEVPAELANLPLFPAICGRGQWQVRCRFAQLSFPGEDGGCFDLAVARSAGDASEGPCCGLRPALGVPILDDISAVCVGCRVALHVLSGAYDGWHVCMVADVDDTGCYLHHEEDGFTEYLPWSYLKGARYKMELLPTGIDGFAIESTDLETVLDRFSELKTLIMSISQRLTEQQVEAIDQHLVPGQRALIQWLAACHGDAATMLDAEVPNVDLSSSVSLQEWLGILELTRHACLVREWCDQQGAASLAEILDNREDLASAILNLSQSERDRLLGPSAAEAAILVVVRMQTRELEKMLLIIASRITCDQWLEIEGDIAPHGQVLIARLHSMRAGAATAASSLAREHGVITSGVACVSRRDAKLMDTAKRWGSKDLCQSCGRTCTHGHVSQDDTAFYCSDCWSAWEENIMVTAEQEIREKQCVGKHEELPAADEGNGAEENRLQRSASGGG